jgi:pimeloyl-ACP methyl ester carboxylesterase
MGMRASFIPATVERLVESTSIALARNIEAKAIATPLSPNPIQTTFVRQGNGGTPILLLHGFDSSVLEFRRLLPLLAAENETVTVDLLGFGFTDRQVQPAFDPNAIKTHLYSFWKQAIARPVTLVGASMGGAVAIDFALTYPEAIEQLVLLDSAGFGQGPIIGKFLFPPLDYLAAEFLRRPRVRRGISRAAYYNKSLNSEDAQLCAALHLEMPGWHRALIAFTKSGGYGSFRDRLGQISQPTLVVWGANDEILGTKDAETFAAAIPNSKLVWIADCGHVPHLEKPQDTAREILTFGDRSDDP